jgi:serralysin
LHSPDGAPNPRARRASASVCGRSRQPFQWRTNVTDGTNTTTLDFNGSYTLANFKFASDGSGGTIVYDPPASQNSTGQAIGSTSSNFFASAGQDTFVYAPNFGQVSIANFTPATDTIQFSKTFFANAGALMAATHEDSSGNAVITDAAHDTITIQHVTAAQLLAHLNDFHFV